MPGVLATAAFRQRRPRHIGQPERVIQFAVSEPSGVGGDPAAVEFQLQAAVEIDPKRNLIRFTRRVFHPRAPASTTICWNSCQRFPLRFVLERASTGLNDKAFGGQVKRAVMLAA